MYSVYVHTSPDGKKYVGITSREPEKRWANGKGYSENKHFYRAIKKYGWENFSHEIIYTGLTEDEASETEKYLISKFDLTNFNKGYNIRDGGTSGYHCSESTKEKMKKNHKDFKGKNHPSYGKHRTKEAKIKMSIAKKGKRTGYDSIRGICVIQMKDGRKIKEWGSMMQAGKCLGIDNSGIAKACKGIQRTAGGYQWKIKEELKK